MDFEELYVEDVGQFVSGRYDTTPALKGGSCLESLSKLAEFVGQQIINELNTREIATMTWLLVLFAWMVIFGNTSIKQSFVNLVKSFFNWKIQLTIAAMVLYVVGIVMALWKINLWTPSLLKDTVFWLLYGFGYIMKFVSLGRKIDEIGIWKEVARESIRSISILEFLVNAYTFHLAVELVLVPIMALLYILEAVAEIESQKDKRYAPTVKFLNGLRASIGLIILVVVTAKAVSDLNNLTRFEMLRELGLPALLSLLFIPFILGTVLSARYEILFVNLRLNRNLSRVLRLYAKLRIICYCRLSISRVNAFMRTHGGRLRLVTTRKQIDELFLYTQASAGLTSSAEAARRDSDEVFG